MWQSLRSWCKTWVTGLLLVVVVLSTSCSSTPGTNLLTGNYRNDVETVVSVVRQAIATPTDAPEAAAVREEVLSVMDAFTSRYSINKFANRVSYTTLRSVMNTVASNYRKSRIRPISQAKIDRVLAELDRAEQAVKINR